MKIQTVFVRQMRMPGQRAVNLRPNFLGVNRWRRSRVLSDASAMSVPPLPAAAPKAASARLTFGQRRASRVEGLHLPRGTKKTQAGGRTDAGAGRETTKSGREARQVEGDNL